MTATVLTTTKVRTYVRAAVTSAVGAAVSFGIVQWSKIDHGYIALLAPAIATAYYTFVGKLENRFPKLGWLLGVLPQPKQPTGGSTVK